MMSQAVTLIMDELEREGEQRISQMMPAAERLYRALGDSAIGLRAAYLPHERILELLIEIPSGWSGDTVIPEWMGMGHEIMDLRLLPRTDAHHLRLYLTSPEHRDIFLMVCEDLVEAIENITDAGVRVREIENCLLRWRRFFERTGSEGLSKERQQGLLAELFLLQRMMEAGIEPIRAISAWKGSERGYHDFDLGGFVAEAKSTRTKEPRSVFISNERQLDDRGLKSLHLYVLNIHEAEGGGITLPEQVEAIRAVLVDMPAAISAFNRKLTGAGYLNIHVKHYTRHFINKSEDLYHVTDNFPRIINIPAGTGNLRYKVFLSACESFRVDSNNYLMDLREKYGRQT